MACSCHRNLWTHHWLSLSSLTRKETVAKRRERMGPNFKLSAEQRISFTGLYEMEGGEEGSQHKQRFCLLQIWTGETLSVARFKNQPASKQCWRVLQLPHWSMWMPIFMSFFSGLESRENLPTNLTLHWRNLLVILKSTATSPELLLFSAFLWIA